MNPYPSRIEVQIGPLFIRAITPVRATANIVPLGVSLEVATIHSASISPLFRKMGSSEPDRLSFKDIVLHESEIPCGVTAEDMYVAKSAEGRFFPLDAVLVGLYREFRIQRSIFTVLGDCRETIPFEEGYRNANEKYRTALVSTAGNQGFVATDLDAFGRYIRVGIGWVPPQDREKSRVAIHAGGITFRPLPDGTLGEGKWVEPRHTGVGILLFAELRRIIQNSPIHLLNEAGKQGFLSEFEWTPLAKMTTKQARMAKIKFICEHPEFATDLRDLADAMRTAGLYANTTSLGQITKSLPGIVGEANATTD